MKTQRTAGPENQATRGPRDRRTAGPEDRGTRGPGDQRTAGPEGQRPRDHGPRDQGPGDHRATGLAKPSKNPTLAKPFKKKNQDPNHPFSRKPWSCVQPHPSIIARAAKCKTPLCPLRRLSMLEVSDSGFNLQSSSRRDLHVVCGIPCTSPKGQQSSRHCEARLRSSSFSSSRPRKQPACLAQQGPGRSISPASWAIGAV